MKIITFITKHRNNKLQLKTSALFHRSSATLVDFFNSSYVIIKMHKSCNIYVFDETFVIIDKTASVSSKCKKDTRKLQHLHFNVFDDYRENSQC